MKPAILKLALAACVAACTSAAQAQHHDGHGAPSLHLDQRYHHDHYYPPVGFGLRVLPVGAVRVGWHQSSWFFHAGVWFRPAGVGYVVAAPPVGIVLPYLPPAYVTLSAAGVPYYYANGVYYATSPEGYIVVAPPAGAMVAQVLPPAAALPPTLIIYPRNGQDNVQADADRAACNQWAGGQPGANADPNLFQRGFAACMDGRGYTVR